VKSHGSFVKCSETDERCEKKNYYLAAVNRIGCSSRISVGSQASRLIRIEWFMTLLNRCKYLWAIRLPLLISVGNLTLKLTLLRFTSPHSQGDWKPFCVQFKYYRKVTRIGKDKPCSPWSLRSIPVACLRSTFIMYGLDKSCREMANLCGSERLIFQPTFSETSTRFVYDLIRSSIVGLPKKGPRNLPLDRLRSRPE